MKTTNLHTSTKAKTKARTQAAAPALEYLQGRQALLAATSAAPVMIGLWAAACFVSALITSGPLALARGWLQAVTGM